MKADLMEIIANLKSFPNFLERRKKSFWLIIASSFLVCLLILLNNLNVIPLQWESFIFFTTLAFLLALYRPSWSFLLFLVTIPLENINLIPVGLGIDLRPYQLFGILTIGAIIIKTITRRLNFHLQKNKLEDYLIIFMLASGLVTSLLATSSFHLASFKLMFILLSFVLFYFLVKSYLQNEIDVKKVLPFILSSGVIVILYGLWQNIRFNRELNSFEVMLGRPNATFTEADWLGIYLVLLLSLVYVLIFYFSQFKKNTHVLISVMSSYLLLMAIYMLLILTVSRSAWLASLSVTIAFLILIATNLKFNFRKWKVKKTLILASQLSSAFLISLCLIMVMHLSKFQLFNRVQSTQTGLQKITVACDSQKELVSKLPSQIKNIKELKKYSCHFINLEEISKEKKAGKIITQVYRPDPNISIRGQIYQQSWKEIKKHPLLGIGWGSIGSMLGQDGQGNYLNTSNIFLETWLGMGLGGFLALIILLGVILFKAVRKFYQANDYWNKTWSLFVIISWCGIIVVNLFNAGMLLGVFWLWLGAVVGYDSRIKTTN